jgi:hypothetical protein
MLPFLNMPTVEIKDNLIGAWLIQEICKDVVKGPSRRYIVWYVGQDMQEEG